MKSTHTRDCIHPQAYQGPEECAPEIGDWDQPEGCHAEDAVLDDASGEAPWCRIRERAWELQEQGEQ